MVKHLHPSARDAAQRRINRITAGVIAASVAGTLGIGAGIAYAAAPPKPHNKTDFAQKSVKQPASKPTKAATPQAKQQTAAPKPAPVNDKPESSSGDEQTTSGGS